MVQEFPRYHGNNNPGEDMPDDAVREPGENDRRHGREIEGLPSRLERFTHLQEGADFEYISKNDHVISEASLENFVIFIDPHNGSEQRMIHPPHWRAVTTPDVHSTVHFSREGDGKQLDAVEHFYVVNTKGVGYLKPTVREESIDDYTTWIMPDDTGQQRFGYKVLGLSFGSDYLDGEIIDKSQHFVEEGLRSEIYWGITNLKQVMYQGKRTSLDQMRKLGVIPARKDFIPSIGVRLLKTNDRIEEAARADHQRRSDIFKKAFETFNRETKDKKLDFSELMVGRPDDERIFFSEFARRMGENVATLLNIGYSNFYMHSSNITMAAEIADIGTMKYWKDEHDKQFKKSYGGVRMVNIKDMRDAAYDLRILFKAARELDLHTGSREELNAAFLDGFNEILDPDRARKHETNPEKAREWMQKISDMVLVRRERLPSLQHYDIEDWGISVEE